MTKEEAVKLITIYGEAWEKRDADLVLSIFTEDATYLDPKEGEVRGHEGIKEYWVKKVQGEQKDISFQLLNVWVDGDTVIAEWHANFTDVPRNLRIAMDEVAIFSARGDRFSSLREYYKTTKTPL